MGLRRKAALAIILIYLMLFASISIVSRTAILSTSEDSDREMAMESLGRVSGMLHSEVETLDMIAYDWAAWNDTYTYMDDRNPEYIESNIVAGTFEGMMLNLIMYVDPEGDLAFASTYDPETGAEPDNSAELVTSMMAVPGLFDARNREGTSGIISTASGLLMLASRPITDSQEALLPNGFLLMGRLLDGTVAERFSVAMLLDIELRPLDLNGSEDFLMAAAQMRDAGEPTFVQNLDDGTMAGYALLNDIHGAPAMVVRIEMPRTIYQHGLRTSGHFQAFLLAVMGAIGLATVLFLERQILGRLADLDSRVNSIGLDADRSARVPVAGSDEISKLASNINSMLDLRGRSESMQAELNSRLNSKVEELETYKRLTVNRELRMEELKRELESLKEGRPNAN